MAKQTKASAANLGFEDKLWAAADKLAELSAELYAQMTEAEELDAAIRQNLEVLGYGE